MKNRIRLPFYITRPQFPTTREVFTNSQGVTKAYSATIRKTYQGVTDSLPKEWHEKLVIALNHKDVTIEGVNFTTGIAMDSDYEIDWEDFLDNPIAPANFTVTSTPFRAISNNCMTCEEVQQLSLEDDYTDEIFEENAEVQYPYPVIQNDTICCSPFEITVEWYNTDYLDSFTIDNNGNAVFVVNALAPIINNVHLATYRVTCESGQYDEADIYGNINGTLILCIPPTNLQVEVTEENPEDATYSWDAPDPAPGSGYEWALYESSNIYTPVYSGNTSGTSVLIEDIPEGTYTFAVRSVCGGGNYSTWQMLSGLSPRPSNPETCGKFTITYIPEDSEGMQTFSYIDCNGDIQSGMFSQSGVKAVCMLTDENNVPIYFAASTADITYNYTEPC